MKILFVTVDQDRIDELRRAFPQRSGVRIRVSPTVSHGLRRKRKCDMVIVDEQVLPVDARLSSLVRRFAPKPMFLYPTEGAGNWPLAIVMWAVSVVTASEDGDDREAKKRHPICRRRHLWHDARRTRNQRDWFREEAA